MNAKDVLNLFDNELKNFSMRKDEFCKNPGRDFSRNRKQNYETLIRSILALNGSTLTNELLKIHRYSIDTPTASAFIQQRAKLSDTAFPCLFKSLNQKFDKDITYKGYKLLAIDGSHIHVPNNPDDPDSYVQARPDEHYHNEFHLNAIWDVMQGTFVDAVVQKYRTQNEDKALIEMVNRSELTNALIICDRGYEGYNNMAHLQESGWKYVIRIKDKGSYGIIDGLDIPDNKEFDVSFNLSLTRKGGRKIKELIKNGKNQYKYIPSTSTFDFLPLTKRNDPAEFFDLQFRVIRFQISDNNYEVLITNLPSDEFQPEKVKEIYRMRWGIETAFRDLKYIVGLLKFHSKKSQFVTQEIYANLIMYNMTVIISACTTVPSKKRKYTYKICFTVTANIVKRFLTGEIPSPVVERLIRQNMTPVRPNRSYVRKKTPLKASLQFSYRIA